MLELLLFAFGIMYTPGPVNILSLNQGMNKRFKKMIGFFMQLFNPKAPLAVLPIATISFPANGITDINIAIMSLVLSVMAGMAPCSYAFL